jgi:hypothetical protein
MKHATHLLEYKMRPIVMLILQYTPIILVFGGLTAIASYKNYECATTDFAYGETITIDEYNPGSNIERTHSHTPPLHKNIDMCKAAYAISFFFEACVFLALGKLATQISMHIPTAILPFTEQVAVTGARAESVEGMVETVGNALRDTGASEMSTEMSF